VANATPKILLFGGSAFFAACIVYQVRGGRGLCAGVGAWFVTERRGGNAASFTTTYPSQALNTCSGNSRHKLWRSHIATETGLTLA
jgi:hypothetical protein